MRPAPQGSSRRGAFIALALAIAATAAFGGDPEHWPPPKPAPASAKVAQEANSILQKGKAAIRKKDYAAACADTGRAVALDPADGQFWFWHAVCLGQAERWADSQKHNTAYLAAFPDDPWPYTFLGEAELKLGRDAASLDAWRRLYAREPGFFFSAMGMAIHAAKRGKPELAARLVENSLTNGLADSIAEDVLMKDAIYAEIRALPGFAAVVAKFYGNDTKAAAQRVPDLVKAQEKGDCAGQQRIMEDIKAKELARATPRKSWLVGGIHALGMCWKAVGKGDDAVRELKLARELYLADHAGDGLVILYSELGHTYEQMRRAPEAEAAYRAGLALAADPALDGEMTISGANLANNLAALLRTKGKFDEARRLGEAAVAAGRKWRLFANLAVFENTLTNVLISQGDYRTAEPLIADAAGLDERRGADAAAGRRNLAHGIVLENLRRYDEAEAAYKKAQAAATRAKDGANVGRALNGLAMIRLAKGDTAGAAKLAQESISRLRGSSDKVGLAAALADSVNVAIYEGRAGDVLPAAQEAVSLLKDSGDTRNYALALGNLGAAQFFRGERKAAAATYKTAHEVVSTLGQGAGAEQRRQLLSLFAHYSELEAAANALAGDAEAGVVSADRGRARTLSEALGAKLEAADLTRVRAALRDDEAIVMFSGAQQNPILAFVIRRDGVSSVQLSKESWVDKFWPATQARLAPLLAALPGQRPSAVAGVTTPTRQKAQHEHFEDMVNGYRASLLEDGKTRGLMKKTAAKTAAATAAVAGGDPLHHELGRALFDLLIEPLQAKLQGVRRLVVVPDGILAFVPFEALLDTQSRHLVQTHDVSYAMSLASWLALTERPPVSARSPLLAIGGAPYEAKAGASRGLKAEPGKLAPPAGESETDRAARIQAAVAGGAPLRSIYDELGYGQWTDLPGTLKEVTALGKAYKGSLILSGAKASETELKKLGKSLGQYRRVHFATHGFAVTEHPALSALVLSQAEGGKSGGKEDGFLRVAELADLGFAAETITLSACETGLGKIYRGEGVYGLAQPLLEKAARRVNVSLWPVPDEATTKLMLGMYARADELGDVRALSEVKRQAAAGSLGEDMTHPYYWAGFVQYGP